MWQYLLCFCHRIPCCTRWDERRECRQSADFKSEARDGNPVLLLTSFCITVTSVCFVCDSHFYALFKAFTPPLSYSLFPFPFPIHFFSQPITFISLLISHLHFCNQLQLPPLSDLSVNTYKNTLNILFFFSNHHNHLKCVPERKIFTIRIY